TRFSRDWSSDVCSSDLPLKMMNRHGLIAGATGTGKTKTLQIIAEGLSDNGIPVMLMDIKGDLSGIAEPGSLNAFIEERYRIMGRSEERRVGKECRAGGT